MIRQLLIRGPWALFGAMTAPVGAEMFFDKYHEGVLVPADPYNAALVASLGLIAIFVAIRGFPSGQDSST